MLSLIIITSTFSSVGIASIASIQWTIFQGGKNNNPKQTLSSFGKSHYLLHYGGIIAPRMKSTETSLVPFFKQVRKKEKGLFHLPYLNIQILIWISSILWIWQIKNRDLSFAHFLSKCGWFSPAFASRIFLALQIRSSPDKNKWTIFTQSVKLAKMCFTRTRRPKGDRRQEDKVLSYLPLLLLSSRVERALHLPYSNMLHNINSLKFLNRLLIKQCIHYSHQCEMDTGGIPGYISQAAIQIPC